MAQLMDAKAAASQAKQGGDKGAQTQAGREIARLARGQNDREIISL